MLCDYNVLCMNNSCILFQALHLPAGAPYQLYKPLRRAKLNVSPTISRTCVLNQLEDLWARAIEECLDIPRRDFKV